MTAMKISDIHFNGRHRKDLGDIEALAESIKGRGLLHPPVIMTDGTLVCGLRRIEAARRLGWKEIEVRQFDPDDALLAERDENEVRKEFTVSERVAIKQAIEERIGKRRGERTDKELSANWREVPAGQKTAEYAAKKAGFESEQAARRAEQVVANGVPELVDAVDKGDVSVSAAAEVAKLPKAEQKQAVARGPKAVKDKAAEIRGQSKVNGVLTDDPPDIARARAKGKIGADVIPEVDEPEGESEQVTREAGEDEPRTDEEWLETLPARKKLHPTRLKGFDKDALAFRALMPHVATLRHHAGRLTKGEGEYAYRVRTFLKIERPDKWAVCVATEYGGCGGSGLIGMLGQCPKCFGRGYTLR